MDNYRKWLLLAPAGLSLSGLGVALVGEANNRKVQGKNWFWLGTLGLCCLNAGIALVAESAKASALIELGQANET